MSLAKERKQIKLFAEQFVARVVSYYNSQLDIGFDQPIKLTFNWNPSRNGATAYSNKDAYKICFNLAGMELFDYSYYVTYQEIRADKEIGSIHRDQVYTTAANYAQYTGLEALIIHEVSHLIYDFSIRKHGKKQFKAMIADRVKQMPCIYPNFGRGFHGPEWQYLYREGRKYFNLTV